MMSGHVGSSGATKLTPGIASASSLQRAKVEPKKEVKTEDTAQRTLAFKLERQPEGSGVCYVILTASEDKPPVVESLHASFSPRKAKKEFKPEANMELEAVLPITSYTIITVPVAENLAWLHSRMPAVLQTDADIDTWLDPATPVTQALQLLQPCDSLQWHPVSSKASQNIEGRERELKIASRSEISATILLSWLSPFRSKRSPRSQLL